MCIRDRRTVEQVHRVTCELHLDFAREQGVRHWAAQHDAQAVSYTHLRAHETVLDLVCRLLLDKKQP